MAPTSFRNWEPQASLSLFPYIGMCRPVETAGGSLYLSRMRSLKRTISVWGTVL